MKRPGRYVKDQGNFEIRQVLEHFEAFNKTNGKWSGSSDTLQELEEDLKKDYGEEAE